MEHLRIALIGCGLISEAHVRGYLQHGDRAKVTVYCDVDIEKAQRLVEKFGCGIAVQSVKDVLADPDVNAIDVCTPHHLHTDIVVAAARAGKHIICQKPLAKTLEDCDTMIAAARDCGVVLYYGEINRTADSVVKAKAAIEEGRIGTIVGMQASFAYWQGGPWLTTPWRYNPDVSGGGQLLDGGIHAVDTMVNLCGPVYSVSCMTTSFRAELGGEDTAVVNLRFASGPLGTLFSSQSSGSFRYGSAAVVFGTEGVLTLGGQHGALTLYKHDLPDGREVLLESSGNSFATMVGRYLDTVLDGTPNPSPGESGRENLRVVLAAYESAANGREVVL